METAKIEHMQSRDTQGLESDRWLIPDIRRNPA
jgi:hypothetical protein